ncbi:MAG TPA: DNA alkylation repair protein [bacterium]|nr:DNA alkylation repair protein [bacterium]
MTFAEIMSFLKTHENPQGKKVLMRHGAREPFYGVRIADLKIVVKQVKKDYELSKRLYATGNSDAMYLAGLIADETRMTKTDLQDWVEGAYWYMLSESTVPGIAAETPFGIKLAKKWMKSKDEMTACAGWATYNAAISTMPAAELDLAEIDALLNHVEHSIHTAPNRVRYDMNNFIISVGIYIPELSEKARRMANSIGKVSVDVGNTACAVPYAPDYIAKALEKGKLGKKRKVARC